MSKKLPTLADFIVSDDNTTITTDHSPATVASQQAPIKPRALAPSKPLPPELAPGSDSGLLGDGITKFSTPTLIGVADANLTVVLYEGNGNNAQEIGRTTTDSSGKWSFQISAPLADGKYHIRVITIDANGVESQKSGQLLLDIDTVAPTAPGPADLVATSDSGISNTDNYTNDTTPTLTGFAPNGANVSLYDNGNPIPFATIKAAGGTWTYTPPTAWLAGEHRIVAAITDKADNRGEAAELVINIDNTGPVVTKVAITSATGAPNYILNAGDVVSVSVSLNQAIFVTGAPQLALNIGGSTVKANYAFGNGTNTLVFSYTILDEQNDANGIAIAANSLTLNGGKLTDAAGNIANLAHGAVADNASYQVDTVTPSIAEIAITSAGGVPNGPLNAGDVVNISVSMSEATIVNGVPQLELDIGGSTVLANYVSGSGSNTLVFSYTILAGQNDDNGIAIPANCFNLNGGTLMDAAGNEAILKHDPVEDNASYRVDTIPPTVTKVEIAGAVGAPNGILNAGDVVNVSVTMSEVSFVTGTPKLALNIGGSTVQANYASGSGSNTLVFSYTILAGQNDANGIAIIANSLVLNGGTLTDAAGNDANLTHAAVADNASYPVDTITPTVTKIEIASAVGAPNGILNAGDVVNVSVTMSEATIVNGVPQLALDIGGSPVQANYVSGSGSNTLVFSYTILAGQNDTDGIAIAANSLTLNGGTLMDTAGNIANLAHGAVADNASYPVDTITPTVTKVEIAGAVGAPNGILNAGDVVNISVTMSEVSFVNGVPQLALDIGGSTVQANYVSGSGSNTLVFSYTILAGQNDTDGIAIAANSLTLNGGALMDTAGNIANLAHGAVADNASYPVDTITPTVTKVEIAGAVGAPNGILNAGDVVNVSVTMSEATIVNGVPQLALNIGGSTVQANYASGSGSNALVFSYTILAGQNDTDGIAIAANSVTLNGGTLMDTAGNIANLAHGAVADNASYRVDTITPTVTSIEIASAVGAQNGILNAGDVVNVSVTMSEVSFVTGTPKLALNIGGSTVQANYASGSGSNTLVFSYTILAGQNDANGIAIIANSLVLNGGTLTDAAGNDANLTHAAVADNASYPVDTTAPTASVTAATISNSSHAVVQSTEPGSAYLVNTSVNVTDLASITGAIDALWNQVGIATSNTATNLTAAGLADGNYVVYAQDAAGNLSAASGNIVTVDNIAASILNVAITSAFGAQNGTLNAGDVVNISVTMSEATIVNGVPQLKLDIGGSPVLANYASGSGSNTLVFSYTILAGQNDANGIAIIANSLVPNGGTLKDAAGNIANLAHGAVADNASYRVDTIPPTVTKIEIAGAVGAQNNTLNAGDVVNVSVTMSEVSFVTGTPQLALNIGGSPVQAKYVSGSGSNALVFSYTILAGQNDANGIAIIANSLVPNGGTLKDAAGNDANLTHAAVADNAAYMVDTIMPTVSLITGSSRNPNIDNAVVQSTEPGAVYLVHASQTVTNLASITSAADALWNQVAIISPNSPTTLVAAGLVDGSYKAYAADAAGNLSAASGNTYTIDTVRPSIAIATNDSDLRVGETAILTFSASEAVFGFDAADISFTGGSLSNFTPINTSVYQATFTPNANWTGTATIDIAANGTVDLVGNGNVAASQLRLSVNTVPPEPPRPQVLWVGITSAIGAQNSFLNAGDVVYISVSLSRETTLNAGNLTLNIGGSTVAANYAYGSGSHTLVFSYTIQPGENDANGISIAASNLMLNGAWAALDPVGDNASYKVDTIAPSNFGDANSTLNTINAGAPAGTPTNLTLYADGADTYQLIDSNGIQPFTVNPWSGVVTLNGIQLNAKPYTLTASATDLAGNVAMRNFALVGERPSIYYKELQELYLAYYNRPADPAGLDYWIGDLTRGTTLEHVSSIFYNLPEAVAIRDSYPQNPDSIRTSIIRDIYLNLFDRYPDLGGLNYWFYDNTPNDQLYLAIYRGISITSDRVSADAKLKGADYLIGALRDSHQNLNNLFYAKNFIESITPGVNNPLPIEQNLFNAEWHIQDWMSAVVVGRPPTDTGTPFP